MKKYIKAKLIHFGSKVIDLNKISECSNHKTLLGVNKPSGGFWACPLNAQYSWKDFIKDDYTSQKHTLKSKVIFDFSGKVFIIENVKDLRYLYKRYRKAVPGCSRGLIDWAKVVEVEKVDAIAFLHSAFTAEELFNYNSTTWDCDSIVIFNPRCITAKKNVIVNR